MSAGEFLTVIPPLNCLNTESFIETKLSSSSGGVERKKFSFERRKLREHSLDYYSPTSLMLIDDIGSMKLVVVAAVGVGCVGGALAGWNSAAKAKQDVPVPVPVTKGEDDDDAVANDD